MKKKKIFDCVEMKNQIQEKLLREYQARQSEFSSYADFINQTPTETPQPHHAEIKNKG